jgi:hypothetical protein
MSDYITKPVLKATIQKMITKWVLEQPQKETSTLPSTERIEVHFDKNELMERTGANNELIGQLMELTFEQTDSFLIEIKMHLKLKIGRWFNRWHTNSKEQLFQ